MPPGEAAPAGPNVVPFGTIEPALSLGDSIHVLAEFVRFVAAADDFPAGAQIRVRSLCGLSSYSTVPLHAITSSRMR
jgi:hypothetical protein